MGLCFRNNETGTTVIVKDTMEAKELGYNPGNHKHKLLDPFICGYCGTEYIAPGQAVDCTCETL